MPRPSTFPGLEQLALKSFVQLVIRWCQTQPNGHNINIEALSRSIPVTLANDYMKGLISDGQEWPGVNIRNAMCPSCTHLTLGFTETDLEVARNLDRLKKLICLTVMPHGFVPHPSARHVMTKAVVKHLPSLQKLKCLLLEGKVTDDMNLVEKVVEDCPSLEVLSFQWGMSPNQQVTLEGCQNLKRVCVQYIGESVEDVLAILLTVPQLDTLTIPRDIMGSSLLKDCHGPYSLRRLEVLYDYDAAIGNDVESLALHFPKLQGVRLTRCDDLSPINSMVHLKELALRECTPEQVSVVDSAVFSRLVSLHLTDVPDLQKVLGVIIGPLQGMEKLELLSCEQIDLAQINNLFPNLTSIDLFECQLTSLARNKGNPFVHLERLRIMDDEDTWSPHHLAYMLSHSYGLEVLEILQRGWGLDDSAVHDLLQLNPMLKLKELELWSDHLTPSVTSVIFDYFGEDLESAVFSGERLKDLPNGFVNSMQEKLKTYFFNMRIGYTVFTSLAGRCTLSSY